MKQGAEKCKSMEWVYKKYNLRDEFPSKNDII